MQQGINGCGRKYRGGRWDKGRQGMWKQSETLTQSAKNGGCRKYGRGLYLMGYF